MGMINLRMRPPAVHNTHEVQGNHNPISTRALLYLFMGGIVLTSHPRTFSKTHPQHTYRSCKVSGHACCRVISSVRVSKGRAVRHRAAFSESGLRSFSRATHCTGGQFGKSCCCLREPNGCCCQRKSNGCCCLRESYYLTLTTLRIKS